MVRWNASNEVTALKVDCNFVEVYNQLIMAYDQLTMIHNFILF